MFTAFFFHTDAQIKGVVIDEQGQPVEFANVALYLLPDSILKSGTVTNANGEFSFFTDTVTNACLQISFIGYKTKTVPISPQQTIILKTEATELSEVVVVGARKTFQMQNGNIVANVGYRKCHWYDPGSCFYYVKDKNELFRAIIDRYLLEKQNINTKIEQTEETGLLRFIIKYIEGINNAQKSFYPLPEDKSVLFSYMSFAVGKSYKNSERKW